MNDRGVTDIVGYVLIFSLIVTTVGVVTTTGYGTLEDRQTAERINNIERAFDVLANNVADVYREGAPSRATEMRLAGGTLRYGEPVTIRVESTADPNLNESVRARPLVYAEDDTEIVYVSGAVLRSDGDASIMLREPPFRFDGSTAAIPLVGTYRTSGASSLSTDGTVRVTSAARGVNSTVSDGFRDADGYTVVVESPRSNAWAQYFDSDPGIENVTHNATADTATAEIGPSEAIVPRFSVQFRLSQ